MTIGRQEVEKLTVNPNDALVSHELLFTVNKPAAKVYSLFHKMPLELVLKPSGPLPGVTSTRMMRGDDFSSVGSRRLVRLTNEQTVVEEVVDSQQDAGFTYRVWNCSMLSTRPIEYATGQFWFVPQNAKTMIRWRYSFKLRSGHFPGLLGGLGRLIFKVSFVNTHWVRFMTMAAAAMKRYIEST